MEAEARGRKRLVVDARQATTMRSYGRRWRTSVSHPTGATLHPTSGALRAYGAPAPYNFQTLAGPNTSPEQTAAMDDRARHATHTILRGGLKALLIVFGGATIGVLASVAGWEAQRI